MPVTASHAGSSVGAPTLPYSSTISGLAVKMCCIWSPVTRSSISTDPRAPNTFSRKGSHISRWDPLCILTDSIAALCHPSCPGSSTSPPMQVRSVLSSPCCAQSSVRPGCSSISEVANITSEGSRVHATDNCLSMQDRENRAVLLRHVTSCDISHHLFLFHHALQSPQIQAPWTEECLGGLRKDPTS